MQELISTVFVVKHGKRVVNVPIPGEGLILAIINWTSGIT